MNIKLPLILHFQWIYMAFSNLLSCLSIRKLKYDFFVYIMSEGYDISHFYHELMLPWCPIEFEVISLLYFMVLGNGQYDYTNFSCSPFSHDHRCMMNTLIVTSRSNKWKIQIHVLSLNALLIYSFLHIIITKSNWLNVKMSKLSSSIIQPQIKTQ